MRVWHWTPLLYAVFVLSGAAGAQSKQSSGATRNEAAKREVAKVEERWIDALNRADLLTIDGCWARTSFDLRRKPAGLLRKPSLSHFCDRDSRSKQH
jgi:hypothetical protein